MPADYRRRIALFFDVSETGGGGNNRLIVFREFVEFRLVDEEVEDGATFPPAGVIIEFRHFVKAELFVIVGANPLGGVDCALFNAG